MATITLKNLYYTVDNRDTVGYYLQQLRDKCTPGFVKKWGQNTTSASNSASNRSSNSRSSIDDIFARTSSVNKINKRLTFIEGQIPILKGINLTFQPGLHAIMGPSGCGKTSLIDILNGRKNPDHISYDAFTFNNQELSVENISRNTAYVAQDDLLTAVLTVFENIEFSVKLRTEKSPTQHNIAKAVIRELGLKKCQNSWIGNHTIRGVSGGERKRCAIGMELGVNRAVTILDEPTTGLDASTSQNLIKLLKKLSSPNRGRKYNANSAQALDPMTIIMSIHQPRSSIWNLFDTVTFMNKGEILFKGRTSEALTWITDNGYPCDRFENPADHILDIIHKHGTTLQYKIIDGKRIERHRPNTLQPKFRMRTLKSSTGGLRGNGGSGSYNGPQADELDYGPLTSTKDQFKILMDREKKILIRQPGALKTALVASTLMALFYAGTYYRLDKDSCFGAEDTGSAVIPKTQNRFGLFWILNANIYFSVLSYLNIFIDDLAIFKRETNSMYYSAGPYFFVKLLVTLMPVRLIYVVLYSLISYWAMGLVRTFDAWLMFTLPNALVSMTSGFLVLGLSPWFTDGAVFRPIFIMLLMGTIATSGFSPPLKSIPWVIRWTAYLSAPYYGLQSLAINEYNSLIDMNEKNSSKAICDFRDTKDFVMDFLDIDDFSYSKYWWNQLIMAGMCSVYALLAYLGMRLRSKQKY